MKTCHIQPNPLRHHEDEIQQAEHIKNPHQPERQRCPRAQRDQARQRQQLSYHGADRHRNRPLPRKIRIHHHRDENGQSQVTQSMRKNQSDQRIIELQSIEQRRNIPFRQ